MPGSLRGKLFGKGLRSLREKTPPYISFQMVWRSKPFRPFPAEESIWPTTLEDPFPAFGEVTSFDSVGTFLETGITSSFVLNIDFVLFVFVCRLSVLVNGFDALSVIVATVLFLAVVVVAMVVRGGRVARSSGLVVGRDVGLRESAFGVVSIIRGGFSVVVLDTFAAVSFEILSASSLEGIKMFFGLVPENAGGAR